MLENVKKKVLGRGAENESNQSVRTEAKRHSVLEKAQR